MAIFLLHTITFLAAFLLFQIELIIAKLFLPVYGGSYFVWGACLVFFQALLLLGYFFVHFMTQKYGISLYRKIHLVITFLPFLFFPGHTIKIDSANSALFVAGDVFFRLLATIGPVFFVLATTSVALQMWLAASSLKQKINPYALYATSNAGSLGALLAYPLFFEIVFDLGQQEGIWRAGYLVLSLCTVFLFRLVPIDVPVTEKQEATGASTKSDQILWLLLSGASVMMFMAVTNIMTYAIAPIPLLWVIPLGIYLLAFILSFKAAPWCPFWIKKNIFVFLIMGGLLFLLLQKKSFAAVEIELLLFCLVLFFACLYCQNQLVALKPSSHHELTLFYLMISLGGFLGGILTSWVMPLISKTVMEYLLALTLIVIAWWIIERKNFMPPSSRVMDRVRAGALVVIPILLCWFWIPEIMDKNPPAVILKKRNYYGMYEIAERNRIRILVHGTTLHGAQLLAPGLEQEPTSFFSRTSGAGEIFTWYQPQLRSIGVIGLGVGTLTAYTEAGQTMDIYELDPDMDWIAKDYFSYLKNARGKINLIYGDARRSLDQLPDRKYDLFVVDAFGGDSIPFHLLTLEAIEKYREHLNPGGFLLFHISNRYIRLEAVLTQVAEASGAWIAYRMTSGKPFGIPASWAVVTWDEPQFRSLVMEKQWEPISLRIKERHRVWTDGYFNIFPFIDFEKMKQSFLNFKLENDL